MTTTPQAIKVIDLLTANAAAFEAHLANEASYAEALVAYGRRGKSDNVHEQREWDDDLDEVENEYIRLRDAVGASLRAIVPFAEPGMAVYSPESSEPMYVVHVEDRQGCECGTCGTMTITGDGGAYEGLHLHQGDPGDFHEWVYVERWTPERCIWRTAIHPVSRHQIHGRPL